MKYLFLLLLGLSLQAQSIEVTIRYGGHATDKVVTTEYEKGMTALDVLKKVSAVKSSQTGSFTFVRSIDGVKSVVGEYGWFYEIDGKSVPKTADHYQLTDAKTMTWTYKVEACY